MLRLSQVRPAERSHEYPVKTANPVNHVEVIDFTKISVTLLLGVLGVWRVFRR